MATYLVLEWRLVMQQAGFETHPASTECLLTQYRYKDKIYANDDVVPLLLIAGELASVQVGDGQSRLWSWLRKADTARPTSAQVG